MKSVLKSIFIIYLTMMTRVNGVSTDCPLVMRFLQGLNMNITEPILFQSIPADCCGYSKQIGIGGPYINILCSGSAPNEQVWYIDIAYAKINGTIQSEFLPPAITSLEIYQTTLNTTLPSDLPNTLDHLRIVQTPIYGKIPDTLPTSLIYFEVYETQLSGLPTSFPAGVTRLWLDVNRFTKMPNFPPNVEAVGLGDNLIDDAIPSSLPSTLSYLYAGNNLINGTIPFNLPSLLIALYLNNNRLTGAIPTLMDPF
eukprot:NODE_72_length_24857_cov_0.454399.p10 type:complete len:254 gc:universal NODE_72_length_24857_cov_0.454399:8219-7458(-)